MKPRRLLVLPLVMTLLFVPGGCKSARTTITEVGPVAHELAPFTDETVKKAAAILGAMGDQVPVHQGEDALEATIARMAQTSNRIKSVDDLARVGRRVRVEEILQAAQRERSVRDRISGELTRIAKNVESSDVLDFGAAVVEAHCSGLKHELETGKPASARDYIIYLVLELVKNEIPTPESKEIAELANNLVKVANGLYALTSKDEAVRRAYIKDMCKIS